MAEKSQDQPATVTAPAASKPKPATRPKFEPLPPFNVVLLDDDDHTVDYVIEMLGVVFAHNVETSLQMAKEVDESGRVIVFTTHKELAEMKCEQILSFGADIRLSRSNGSMAAVIEPAEG